LTGAFLAKKIVVPVHIIHDKTDDVVPFEQSEVLHNAWKNSTLHVTNAFGHRLRDEKIYEDIVNQLQ
jgi:pimeloyl-ACP methyl ester carboxylesterase